MRFNRAFLVLMAALPLACGGPEAGGATGGGRNAFTNRGGAAGATGGSEDLGGSAGDFVGSGGGADGILDAAASDEDNAMAEGGTAGGLGEAAPGDEASAIDARSDATQVAADAAPGSDASTSDAGISDAGTSDVAVDDAAASDASGLSQCTAQPQNDSQCGSRRPPHRYVCPIALATPSGCERTGTSGSNAFYCCN